MSANPQPPHPFQGGQPSAARDADHFWSAFAGFSAPALWIAPQENRILRANLAACELLRRSEPELRGADADEVFAAVRPAAAALQAWSAQTLAGAPLHPEQWDLSALQGVEAEFEVEPSALRLGQELVLHLFLREVSGRVRRERELALSEAKYRRLIETLQDDCIFYIHDRQGFFRYLSPSVQTVLGVRPEELKTRPLARLTDNPVNQEAKDKAEATLDGLRQSSYEAEIQRRDGAIRRLEITEIPLRDERGDVVAIEGVAKDVTARAGYQTELQRRSDFLHSILESFSHPLLVIDADSYEIKVANSAARAFDQSNSSGLGAVACFNFLHCKEKPCEDQVPCPLREIKNASGPLTLERVHRDAHGGLRDVEVHVHPIRDANGRLNAVVVHTLDVTARKEEGRELVKAKEKAEAANQAKTAFLATISHELRTPLNGVLGMLQILELSALDQEQRECALLALSSAQRLQTMITGVLDYGKLEAGELVCKQEPFEIPALLWSVREAFIGEAESKSLRVNYIIDPKVPRLVLGDGDRIRQLLFILTHNAVKFTLKGEIWLSVSVLRRRRRLGEIRLLFSVADTGMGVPEDQLEHIFEPFTQVDASYSREHSGAGLGLAMAKRLAEALGGVLAAQSRLGQGSTFSLNLPLKTPSEASLPPQPHSPP